MNWKRFVRKARACRYILKGAAEPSFSQAGEDLVMHFLFQQLQVLRPSYLDIGANLPVAGSNTYFFYNKGAKGVCIEPDPELYGLIREQRPRDVVLNAGIGLGAGRTGDLHVFPHPYTGWNTFSGEEARRRVAESGIRIKEVKQLSLLDINEVIRDHFDPWPNFISIDVEGMDLAILQTLDFSRYRPEVICAETVAFGALNPGKKMTEIAGLLGGKGYFAYADTYINTIFCREDAFLAKQQPR
jgi:FkbM family methyltransferase